MKLAVSVTTILAIALAGCSDAGKAKDEAEAAKAALAKAEAELEEIKAKIAKGVKPSYRVKLKSDKHGNLTQIVTPFRSISLPKLHAAYMTLPANQQADFRKEVLSAFAILRQEIINYLDTGLHSIRENIKAFIEADDQLHYIFVMDAVTHISGYVKDEQPVKLIQEIKFKPPR